MSSVNYHNINSNDDTSTTHAILIVFFVFIGIFIAVYSIASWLLHKHERTMHHDLEACYALLSEEDTRSYQTFPPSSREAFLQDREVRRMIRHQRFQDHVSGIYQISVRRTDEVSVSSDESESSCEDEESGEVQGEGEMEEEEDDSSESESSDDSDSDSDSDSDEVGETRGLMAMRKPLPKRIAMLRGWKD